MYRRLYFIDVPREKMGELCVNIGDLGQTPRSAASDLGLHCLPVTRLGVFSLQWIKRNSILSDNTIGSLILR